MSDEEIVESTPPEEDGKVSRRDRFKEALARTKTKINKHRDRKEKEELELPDDVNDFLAAGRTSSASTRPSAESSLLYDTSRPSTSDSLNPKPQPQPSPRRVPIPRLDVSTSQRFPNAKLVDPEPRKSDELLRPELYVRSHSAFSTSSSSRKQRIRGLSVGFLDAPPVIIGEGGDEAETPPVEISRAKARARSMSPTGRRPPKSNFIRQLSPIKQTPVSGHGSPADSWLPKPFRRAPTGGQQQDEQNFQLKSIQRVQTGRLEGEEGFLPNPLGRTGTGFSALEKEFEMSLGFNNTPTTASSKQDSAQSQHAPLISPKPMRPPPSYTLIEQGKGPEVKAAPSVQQPPPPQRYEPQAEVYDRRRMDPTLNPPQQRRPPDEILQDRLPPPDPPPPQQRRPSDEILHDRPPQPPQVRHSPANTQPQKYAPSAQPRRSPQEHQQQPYFPPPAPRRSPQEQQQTYFPHPQPRHFPQEVQQQRMPPPVQPRRSPGNMQNQNIPPPGQPFQPTENMRPEQAALGSQLRHSPEERRYEQVLPPPQMHHSPEDHRHERIPVPNQAPPPPPSQMHISPEDRRNERIPIPNQAPPPPPQNHQHPPRPDEQPMSNDTSPNSMSQGSPETPHKLRRKQFFSRLRKAEDEPPPPADAVLQSAGSGDNRRFYEMMNSNNNPPEGWI